ncbi:hypothetical protein BCB4_0146 [Bacillus phage B4]|uniref:Uncharacterized protein n=2 Tax=Bequatrovirus B4 TaxID=1918005 RepID=J9PRT7_9CAUD|nr:hypothetical protein BCB4_0146 [Bacillus phage B4]YP_009783737.1 hypothetical protein QLX26_gp141 [Bacillus phage B5S]MEB9013999.1 hypothetical protein [Bacillus cereus]AEW47375.1 hypothetical protein B5S_0141 [Bacillus phage B5S]AEZ65939.1 hypothetical protein BCB4_0146 [Bacillus phage B4]MEB9190654.1 hypothetical protein [Bacillus cereus]
MTKTRKATTTTKETKGAVKMTKAMLVNAVSNEEVFVEINKDDLVVVTREGVGSTVYNKRYTVEKVVDQFTSEGWIDVTEQNQVMKSEALDTVPDLAIITEIKPLAPVEEEVDEKTAMVAEVDAYTELHAEIAALNKELEKKKKAIRTYMDENKLKVLTGTKGKEVYLQTNKASNSSAEYTTYDVNMIKDILNVEQYSEVTEVRVSASLLKKKITDGEFSEGELKAIERAENYKLGTPKFTLRKVKEEK